MVFKENNDKIIQITIILAIYFLIGVQCTWFSALHNTKQPDKPELQMTKHRFRFRQIFVFASTSFLENELHSLTNTNTV